jgi:hypothetical protein
LKTRYRRRAASCASSGVGLPHDVDHLTGLGIKPSLKKRIHSLLVGHGGSAQRPDERTPGGAEEQAPTPASSPLKSNTSWPLALGCASRSAWLNACSSAAMFSMLGLKGRDAGKTSCCSTNRGLTSTQLDGQLGGGT